MEIRGRCFPEDPSKFFKPLFQWLDTNIDQHVIEVQFEIYLEYYNTGTYIRLMELFDMLAAKNSEGHKLEIHWYVEEDDEDSLDNARSFLDVCKIPFKLRTLPTINFGGK